MNLFKTISTTILLVMSFTSLAEVSVIVNTANTDTFDEKTINNTASKFKNGCWANL